MGRAEAYLHGPMRRAYFARRIKADPTSRLAIWALRVAVFAKASLAEPLTIQAGRTRPFLVTLSEYSPPRD